MEIKELFDAYNCSYDFAQSPSYNFNKAAESLEKGVILINVSKIPGGDLVEFDLAPLMTNPISGDFPGLNMAILNKFQNVKRIPLAAEPTDETVQLYGKGKTSIVILGIRYKQFRQLGEVPFFKSRTILDGVPARLHYYNRIIERQMLQKSLMRKPRQLAITYESYKRVIDAEVVKAEVKTTLTKWFNDNYEPIKYSEFGKYTSPETLLSIRTILIDILDKYHPSHKKSLERNLTFISRVSSLAYKFIKEYKGKLSYYYASQQIVAEKFDDRNEQLVLKYILGWFLDACDEALIMMDTSPNSITDLEISIKQYYREVGLHFS